MESEPQPSGAAALSCIECGAPLGGGHTGYCSKSMMRSGGETVRAVGPEDCQAALPRHIWLTEGDDLTAYPSTLVANAELIVGASGKVLKCRNGEWEGAVVELEQVPSDTVRLSVAQASRIERHWFASRPRVARLRALFGRWPDDEEAALFLGAIEDSLYEIIGDEEWEKFLTEWKEKGPAGIDDYREVWITLSVPSGMFDTPNVQGSVQGVSEDV